MTETTANTTTENPTATPETEAVTIRNAPLGNRIIAALIDGLLAGAVSIVPIVGWIAGAAYMVTRDALPFLDGQSIGKKAMKLRAVQADTGKPLTNDWNACVVRNIVLFIPFFAIVELIILASSNTGQRLGDQWAKTRVITCES